MSVMLSVIFVFQKTADYNMLYYMFTKFYFKLGKVVVEIFDMNVFGIQKWNDLRF
jgi:hypothetical protein